MRFYFQILLACAAVFGFFTPAQAGVFRVGNVAADDVLNVRSGPSVRFDIITELPPGFGGLTKEVCVLVKKTPNASNKSRMSEWCAVSQGSGIIGWVSARYLVQEASALPLFADYPVPGAVCKRVGESDATAEYLDDSADLIACPSGSPAAKEMLAKIGAIHHNDVEGYTLISILRR